MIIRYFLGFCNRFLIKRGRAVKVLSVFEFGIPSRLLYNIVMDKFLSVLTEFFKTFGTSALEAVAVLLVGIIIIKILTSVLRSLFHRTKVEGSAASFIVSVVKAALVLVLFFIIADIFSIDTTSIITIVAASGLAAGLAFQSSLSNLASGVIMLFTKPFRENDYVKIGDNEGTVKKVKITTTELLTPGNVSIIIPNSNVVSGEIYNYSTRSVRRIDITIPAPYANDMDKIKALIFEVIAEDERILAAPEASVYISGLGTIAVEFMAKMWVNNADFYSTKNDFYDKIVKKFAQNGINYRGLSAGSEGGQK